MGEGDESSESGETVEADALEPEDEWPALSALDLDICISEGIPGADAADAERTP